MILLHRFHARKSGDEGRMARLEEAERECQELIDRAENAIRILDERKKENHWRESIERMIHGDTHG